MMGALLLKVLEPFPSLIEGLSILLNKKSDIYPQFCSRVRWKVLAKEGLVEVILSSK